MNHRVFGSVRLPNAKLAALCAALHKLPNSRLFSFGFVAAIQIKIIWDSWTFRDLTGGDTSSYFHGALDWANDLHVLIVWSPLYTAFYGTIYKLLNDAYDATIFHREIIVLLASLGVLAVARRMLPPALALLVAVWWAVLPINFDVYYEVHLFALLPILLAWLFAMRADTARHRGAALAVLVGTTVLVRNELSVACALYALYCLWREVREIRSSHGAPLAAIRSITPKYTIPMAVTAAICLFFYVRTPVSFETSKEMFHSKHVVNMCQVYAAGYAQRHPEWRLSPWTECQGLMAQTFGDALPTLGQMAANNFPALMEHFLWNISLAGNGLQVSLFNATSGLENPDYVPIQLGATYPLWLSLLAFGIVTSACLITFGRWRTIWALHLSPNLYRWAILLAVSAICVPIILTQRPRPEYLYALTLSIMIIIGTSVHILTHRWPRIVEAVGLMIALVTLAIIPSYYVTHDTGRPLRTTYERLRPYQPLLISQPGVIVLGDSADVLANYLGLVRLGIKIVDYNVLAGWHRSSNLCSTLDCRSVAAIYIQSSLINLSSAEEIDTVCPNGPDGYRWLAIGTPAENENGLLLIRQKEGENPPSNMVSVDCPKLQPLKPKPVVPIGPPSAVTSFPAGLMAPGLFFAGVNQDGWLIGKARAKLARPGPSNELHLVGSIPDLSQKLSSGVMKVTVDGVVVMQAPLVSGTFDRVIKIPEATGTRVIDFDIPDTGQLPPPDGRAVSIRLSSISLEDD